MIKKGLPFNILVWPLCGLYPFTKMYPISVNYGRAPTQMYHGKISMWTAHHTSHHHTHCVVCVKAGLWKLCWRHGIVVWVDGGIPFVSQRSQMWRGDSKGSWFSYFQWKLWYKKVEITAEELSRKRLPADTNIL